MKELLSTKVTVLPTTNKDDSIQSFIKIQQQNALVYAAEGRAFQASWNNLTRVAGIPPKPSRNEESGFQTPVLKPRVLITVSPPPFRADQANAVGNAEGRGETSKEALRLDESAGEKLGTRQSVASTKIGKPGKRLAPENTDEEYEDRLAQRRARKRAKRNIMNPEHLSKTLGRNNSEKNNSASASNPRNGAKSKKDNRTKLPAGLALLHGFSASNIGQKRLTLKPGTSFGVFGKGKASANIKVKKKSANRASEINVFSELRFLNPSTKTAGFLRSLEFDGNSDIGSSSENPESKARHPSNRKREASISTLDEDIETSSPSPAVHDNRSKAVGSVADNQSDQSNTRSQLWDIEKENGILASGTASSLDAQVRASTVVLDTHNTAWGMHENLLDSVAKGVPGSPVLQGVIGPSSSSSLCPSHSASQAAQRQPSLPILPDVNHTSSRFFSPSVVLQVTRSMSANGSQVSPRDAISEIVADPSNDPVKCAPLGTVKTCVTLQDSPYHAGTVSQNQAFPDNNQTGLGQTRHSACGTADSLEEALKCYEADDYLFVIPPPPRFSADHCLDIAPTVSVYCPYDSFDRHDGFLVLESYEFPDAEAIVDVGVETASIETFEGVEEFELSRGLEDHCSDYDNDALMASVGDIFLHPGQIFGDVHECYDGGSYQGDPAYDSGEETALDHYHHDDYDSCGDPRVYFGGAIEEAASPGDAIQLQYETMSDQSDDQGNTDILMGGQQFSQGRALLGLPTPHCDTYRQEGCKRATTTEDEVAKNIKGHWLPQRL